MSERSSAKFHDTADHPSPVSSLPVRALFSIREAMDILGLSRATVYRLINSDLIDARKLLGKTLITRASIERLIADLPKVGTKA